MKKLPKELEHLDRYKKYCKRLKAKTYGFFIPQFKENGAKNPDWYEFRVNTIGASEISTLFGVNEFKPAAKLFWEKIGKQYPSINTKFTYWGLEHEASTAKAWRYYDGTDEGYLENKMQGNIIRTNQDLNCYVINIDYPWLSVSLDSLVDANQAEPFNGEIIPFSFPLEIKQLSTFAAAKYKLGFPVAYVYQLHQQMLVWGVPYAELAYLKSGTDFNVVPFHESEDLRNQIIEESKAFWYERIVPGKKLYRNLQLTLDQNDRQQIEEHLDMLEPLPDDTKAYEEFWVEKYKDSEQEVKRQGTPEEYTLAKKYNEAHLKVKELEKEKQKYKNELLYLMGADKELDFGDKGRVVYRDTGKRRTFTVKVE